MNSRKRNFIIFCSTLAWFLADEPQTALAQQAKRVDWHAQLAEARVVREPAAVLLPGEGTEAGMHPRLLSLAATALPITAGVLLVASEPFVFSESRTIINSVLIWSGALVGPAAGHFKSGRQPRGLQGIALRTAIFTAAWALAPTRDFSGGFLPNPSLGGDLGIWLAAVGVIVISDVVDIVAAKPRDAR